MKLRTKKSGFTLVELAIVLVIIGLIVGGVLAGSDLIKAATMQKAVKQVSDTETGAATFRNKYNDLPGDLKSAGNVISGGWSGGILETGMGNGNGLIEATTTGATGTAATATVGVSGESINFYPMLSSAGYVKEALTGIPMSTIATSIAQAKAALLPSALGGDAYMIPSAATDGRNYLLLVGAPSAVATAGVAPLNAAITPLQASNIDSKLDDGRGDTGNVKSVATGAPVPQTAAAGTCYTGSGVYDAVTESKICSISIRASF